ncbi:MAG: sugar phosphate isomerase/epimerase [Sphingobacteriaceae bacterium]|jgi:sugar phosphate isomerase/epimerase|nr:sugar phosphate isomerase/epimerase [Sphingobacteriaceae bacterium]
MRLKFFAPRWGSEQMPWNDFAKKAIRDGYDGVDAFPLLTLPEKADMLNVLEAEGLELVLVNSELTHNGSDFSRYKETLKSNLYTLAGFQTNSLKPRFISSQTGREYYTKDQMGECFDICDEISREIGIEIYHETHRNKWSYAAHVVKDYLRGFPSVKLTLDISHWVCVSESYLEDQEEAVELAIERTAHVHSRVGHIEGPQVTDPRAPENEIALNHHLQWWDKWIASQKSKGKTECTITPEFGPYPYMSYKPFSTEPVADQWEINLYMKKLLGERYQNV